MPSRSGFLSQAEPPLPGEDRQGRLSGTGEALLRRIDQQQQKAINWLSPGAETPLETTIGYEQVAIDLTVWVARNEPDPYLKQTFDFGLLEDFDHLYRYANLYELLNGALAEELTQELSEIMPRRPTAVEHRHPSDDIRR